MRVKRKSIQTKRLFLLRITVNLGVKIMTRHGLTIPNLNRQHLKSAPGTKHAVGVLSVMIHI